jgi:hypothetical protein
MRGYNDGYNDCSGNSDSTGEDEDSSSSSGNNDNGKYDYCEERSVGLVCDIGRLPN